MSNLSSGETIFKEQLEQLKYDVDILQLSQRNFVKIKNYKVIKGEHKDKMIEIAFQVPADFPINPPRGIYVKLDLTVNNSKDEKTDVKAANPLDNKWKLLSRIYVKWNEGPKKTVKVYMDFVCEVLKVLNV